MKLYLDEMASGSPARLAAPPSLSAHVCASVPEDHAIRLRVPGRVGASGAAGAGVRPSPLAAGAVWQRPIQLPFAQMNEAQVQQQGTSGLSAKVVGTTKPSVIADVEVSGVPPRGRPV